MISCRYKKYGRHKWVPIYVGGKKRYECIVCGKRKYSKK